GLDEPNLLSGSRRFDLPGSPHQHFVAEVGSDDGHRPPDGTVVSEGEVSGAGAEIENRTILGRPRRHEPGRSAPPSLVDVQAQKMIQEVVGRRDLAEHPADADFPLVEQFRFGHGGGPGNRVVDAPSSVYYLNRCPASRTTA